VIDIHTHILPGVDDGVKNEDDAVEFARVAVDDGVRGLVATPHCKEGIWENDRARVLEEVKRLRGRLAREGVELDLQPGSEVHIGPDLLAKVRDGRAPTLGDNGKTLLLELSLTQYPVELENLVFELKLGGLEVVFAHPERIQYFQDDVSRYEAVVHQGAYGQITTGSILGDFGSTAREFSEELLRKGLVHVLASDAHGVRRRRPVLGRALESMTEFVGERYARSMVLDVPRDLLDGRTPEIPPFERVSPRRRSFVSRLFGRK
jgi:protein-tyrosine phosphatase